jgi:phospholipid/cholesterol/gamma-HCH transport system substrate-binding protein
MPRTRSLAWSELKIGIAGVVALALLTVMVVAVGGEGGYFWQRFPLKARFENIQGLKEGAVVRLSGKEIGTVTSVEFAGSAVEIQFEVLKDLRPVLTTESVAVIGSLSLLGEPILDITTTPGGTPLEDYAYVRTRESGGALADVSTAASSTLGEIDGLLRQIRAGEGTLGRIVTDDALYTELQGFIASAAAVTRAIQAGEGTLGGLLKDPAARSPAERRSRRAVNRGDHRQSRRGHRQTFARRGHHGPSAHRSAALRSARRTRRQHERPDGGAEYRRGNGRPAAARSRAL